MISSSDNKEEEGSNRSYRLWSDAARRERHVVEIMIGDSRINNNGACLSRPSTTKEDAEVTGRTIRASDNSVPLWLRRDEYE